MVTQKQKGVAVFVILWAIALKCSITIALLLCNANIDWFFRCTGPGLAGCQNKR